MIVTPPVGAVPGAVYVVVTVLPLPDAGLKLPQLFAGVQLHATPFPLESLLTVAANVPVALGASEVGPLTLIERPPCRAPAIVTVAVAVFVVSVTEVAMIVTEPADPGAVYVVAAPLAVLAGLNDPQLFTGMQLHDAPAFAESFATVAIN